MIDDSEKKLATATYHGEKINWTFKTFSTLHKEQYNIL